MASVGRTETQRRKDRSAAAAIAAADAMVAKEAGRRKELADSGAAAPTTSATKATRLGVGLPAESASNAAWWLVMRQEAVSPMLGPALRSAGQRANASPMMRRAVAVERKRRQAAKAKRRQGHPSGSAPPVSSPSAHAPATTTAGADSAAAADAGDGGDGDASDASTISSYVPLAEREERARVERDAAAERQREEDERRAQRERGREKPPVARRPRAINPVDAIPPPTFVARPRSPEEAAGPPLRTMLDGPVLRGTIGHALRDAPILARATGGGSVGEVAAGGLVDGRVNALQLPLPHLPLRPGAQQQAAVGLPRLVGQAGVIVGPGSAA